MNTDAINQVVGGNEILKVHVSNPVPLGEALLILGGVVVLFGLIIRIAVPWVMKESDKWDV